METLNGADQHMIRDMTSYTSLLQSLDLGGKTVIEFGVGTGLLTRAILKQAPRVVVGYEIDPTLIPDDISSNPLVDMRVKDFCTEDFSFLRDRAYAFVSNPPYSQLPFISRFLTEYPPETLVMMVSDKKKDIFFPSDEIALNFGPDDFCPPTRGGHAVIVRTLSTPCSSS